MTKEKLKEEAKKYKSAEEFVKNKLFFAWVKSQGAYSHIKSLEDLSTHDLQLFSKQFNKEFKKYGANEIGRHIRNLIAVFNYDIPEILTQPSQLTDIYNQVIK